MKSSRTLYVSQNSLSSSEAETARKHLRAKGLTKKFLSKLLQSFHAKQLSNHFFAFRIDIYELNSHPFSFQRI